MEYIQTWIDTKTIRTWAHRYYKRYRYILLIFYMVIDIHLLNRCCLVDYTTHVDIRNDKYLLVLEMMQQHGVNIDLVMIQYNIHHIQQCFYRQELARYEISVINSSLQWKLERVLVSPQYLQNDQWYWIEVYFPPQIIRVHFNFKFLLGKCHLNAQRCKMWSNYHWKTINIYVQISSNDSSTFST